MPNALTEKRQFAEPLVPSHRKRTSFRRRGAGQTLPFFIAKPHTRPNSKEHYRKKGYWITGDKARDLIKVQREMRLMENERGQRSSFLKLYRTSAKTVQLFCFPGSIKSHIWGHFEGGHFDDLKQESWTNGIPTKVHERFKLKVLDSKASERQVELTPLLGLVRIAHLKAAQGIPLLC